MINKRIHNKPQGVLNTSSDGPPRRCTGCCCRAGRGSAPPRSRPSSGGSCRARTRTGPPTSTWCALAISTDPLSPLRDDRQLLVPHHLPHVARLGLGAVTLLAPRHLRSARRQHQQLGVSYFATTTNLQVGR